MEIRLRACEPGSCQAMCCYDGVYLADGEEEMILRVIKEMPEFFTHLPPNEPPIVDGEWEGRMVGRKTAIKPFTYTIPDFPPHFTQTRCVFANAEGLCALQLAGIAAGKHKWAFKPRACWLHPLPTEEGEPREPYGIPERDPHNLGERYPGFVTYTRCGRHRDDGLPWQEVLAEELAYLRDHPIKKEKKQPGK